MKKYALLLLLFCFTLALGGMVYKTAHTQALEASAREVSTDQVLDTQAKEDALGEATKEIAREGGKSAIRFLFSLIYK